jgi:MYXO-CTERM domain-containing protein
MKMKTSNTTSKKLFGGLLAIALTGLFSSLANAQLDFDFSFTSGSSLSGFAYPFFPGTVTGELIGLSSSGPSTPTDVIIYTAPAGLGLNLTTPYDFVEQGGTISGTLTVSGNTITAAGPGGLYAVAGETNLQLQGFAGNVNLLSLYSTEGVTLGGTGNATGIPGANYSEVQSAPEPSTWALVVSGLALLAFWRRRARRA